MSLENLIFYKMDFSKDLSQRFSIRGSAFETDVGEAPYHLNIVDRDYLL